MFVKHRYNPIQFVKIQTIHPFGVQARVCRLFKAVAKEEGLKEGKKISLKVVVSRDFKITPVFDSRFLS